jgi:hypothetical protein
MEDPRLAKIRPDLFCKYHRHYDNTCFDSEPVSRIGGPPGALLTADQHPADVEGWVCREGFCKHRTGQYEETIIWAYIKEKTE